MKGETPFSRPEEEEREEAAGMWLARRDRGLTPEERREFAAWLESDPRHRRALEELESAFRRLDRAAALRTAHTAVDPDFLKARPPAEAAALPAEKLAPAAWRPVVLAVVGLAAALVLGLYLNTPSTERMAQGRVVRHAPEQRMLPDGSTMDLASGARVEVVFTPEERRVRLVAGEAHFSVRKDTARPFVVLANGVAVRAVGTAFSVSCAPQAVEVVVAEGRVRVDDSAGINLLAAAPTAEPVPPAVAVPVRDTLNGGERVRIPLTSGTPSAATVAALSGDELQRALGWRSTWLEFSETPLARVVDEFNAYASGLGATRVRVADGPTGRVLVSGKFRADGLDAFVRVLASTFDVSSTREAGGDIVLHRAR